MLSLSLRPVRLHRLSISVHQVPLIKVFILFKWLIPQTSISEQELQYAQKMVMRDGILTQIMGNLTGGAFIVAFALLLGASNVVIGLIAALQALAQILQLPTIYLVEATRNRKALMVFGLFMSRIFWLLLALIPWVVPPDYRVPAMFVALFVDFAIGTIAGLAWNSWMHDLIPPGILGSYMGKRMAVSTAFGVVVTLVAGFGVDAFRVNFVGTSLLVIYSIYIGLGGLIGLWSVYYIARTPEPQMQHLPHSNLWAQIREPLQDMNFRRLLVFLGTWSFAVNLAAPFFTVYMLKRLDLSMGVIVALTVLSQIVNVMFFRLWGKLADRFSNKSVLAESGFMFITTFMMWPFTSLSSHFWIGMSVLLMIHVLAGISNAGVTLCTGNIALKLAPHGKATAYLAVRSFVSGIMATLAPPLGGMLGNWFENKRLSINLAWSSMNTHTAWQVPAMALSGLDFLFVFAFVFGLYALHRLLAVEEVGEAEKGVVLAEFNGEIRKAVRDISSVAGLRGLLVLPYSQLLRLIGERRSYRRPAKAVETKP